MNRRELLMAHGDAALTAHDFELAVGLVEELHDANRLDEATEVYKLIVAAERAGQRPPADDDLSEDYLEALDWSDDELLAGKIVPHEVMLMGRAAVDEYVRRRDAGMVDPDVASAVEAYRRAREAERRA